MSMQGSKRKAESSKAAEDDTKQSRYYLRCREKLKMAEKEAYKMEEKRLGVVHHALSGLRELKETNNGTVKGFKKGINAGIYALLFNLHQCSNIFNS